LARFGIKMPAVPEIGVTGEEVQVTEEDFVPIF
jgi:hypothetical protein